MKLETAYTWETELSKHGNTATAWEGLIMARKLPYMAALRNLRNLFLANMNEEAQAGFQIDACSVFVCFCGFSQSENEIEASI